MHPSYLISLRGNLGLTQTQMAEAIGLKLRAYQAIEGGKSPIRKIHVLAIERVALAARSAPEAGKAVDERYSDKIYIASKTKHAKRWRTIAATHPVSSSWIYEAGEGESTDLHDLWRRCLAEASGSKALVAYREPDEVFKGGWVEIGAALSNGVPVHAVGLNEFTIAHYRGITHHRTMKEAVTAALKEPSRSALASVAPSGATEPLPPIVVNAMIDAYKFAYNEEMRRFGKGWEAKGYDPSREATRKGLAAVFTALAIPQAPSEDVAGLVGRLNASAKESDDYAASGGNVSFVDPRSAWAYDAALFREAAIALTSLSAERDLFSDQSNNFQDRLVESEAEAASLRRKLEELRQAYEAARYVPGDHPIVPAKIGTFMRTAARTLSGASE